MSLISSEPTIDVTSDPERRHPFKALFKGPPGTRKTVAAASFRKRHPNKKAFWFDFDEGFAPVDEHFPDHGIEHRYYGVHNLQDADDKLEHIARNQRDYGLVGIDSVTFMGDTGIGYSRDNSQNANLQKRGFIPLPSMDDYKVEEALMFRVLQFIHRVQIDVILTMHEVMMDKLIQRPDPKKPGEYITIEVKERFTVTAARKTKVIAPAGFTEVWHFHARPENILVPDEKIHYEIQTRNEGGFSAKTALGLPNRIEFGDRQLYDVIREELAKKGKDF